MSAIQHLVAQTQGVPLLRARPPAPEPKSKHIRAVVNNATRRYGPIIEQLRLEGLTHEQIGKRLGIAEKSASSMLSRYRTGIRQGVI